MQKKELVNMATVAERVIQPIASGMAVTRAYIEQVCSRRAVDVAYQELAWDVVRHEQRIEYIRQKIGSNKALAKKMHPITARYMREMDALNMALEILGEMVYGK